MKIDANSIEKACKKAQEELTKLAVKEAQKNYSQAIYSGINDVTVTSKDNQITASGQSVLFIEFGTGITNPDNYPERGTSGVVAHGEYGLKRGKNAKGWRYKGEKGNAPNTEITPSGLVHTYGNIANMSLYKSKEAVKEKAKEVILQALKGAIK